MKMHTWSWLIHNQCSGEMSTTYTIYCTMQEGSSSILTLETPSTNLLPTCKWSLWVLLSMAVSCHRYSSNKEEFEQRVRESVEQCKETALAPDPSDPNSLQWVDHFHTSCTWSHTTTYSIGEWQAEVMRTARKEIFEPEVCHVTGCCYYSLHSWSRQVLM